MSELLLCPRCGDVSRFSSVTELRAHFITYHTYETLLLLSKVCVRSSRNRALLPLPGSTEAQSQSLSLGSEVRDGPLPLEGLVLPWGRLTQAVLLVDIGLEERLGLGGRLGAKVARTLDEVERRVNRQVTRLSAHLDRKEAELKERRENEQRLRHETQELRARVGHLSRQLCAVIEMTDRLNKDLEKKEQELNHRQQEMEDIEGFLTDLAEKEAKAKAKLQVFMEWLLDRADRAERHLLLLYSPVHRYTLSPEVSPVRGGVRGVVRGVVRGGVRGVVSLDDIITDHYSEDMGNRKSFSVSCQLQDQLYHLTRGRSPPMRTLSLDSQDRDTGFMFQTHRLPSDSSSTQETTSRPHHSRPHHSRPHHSRPHHSRPHHSRPQPKGAQTTSPDRSHTGRSDP